MFNLAIKTLAIFFLQGQATALVAPAADVSTGKANFLKYKSALPSDFNVVASGGWNNVYKLNSDPKATLMSLVTSEESTDNSEVDSLVSMLFSRSKGYSADLVDGEWKLLYNRSGKKSPKLQKLVKNTLEKKSVPDSTFDTKAMTFEGTVLTPRGNGALRSTVKYDPVGAGYTLEAGSKKIVIRRIMCDIIGASFKYSKLPKLPLPIRAKGGSLDFLYMDEDIRITKGNKGGLFIHARPDYIQSLA